MADLMAAADRKQWLGRVNRLMTARYCLDSVSAGWDTTDVERYHGFDMPPEEFVDWYGEKYGLYEFEG